MPAGPRYGGVPGTGIPLDIAYRDRLDPAAAGLPAAVSAQAQVTAQSLQIRPPEEVMIPGGIDLFLIERGVVVAPGASVEPATLRAELTSGMVARLAALSIFGNQPDLTFNVVWTLLINGAPIQGLDRLTFFPRVAQSVQIDTEVLRRVPEGGTIGMRIVNNSVGPFTVGASISGWQWPRESGERYTGLRWQL